MTHIDDVLSRRQAAKAEIDKLKTIVEACDSEIMTALDSDEDYFTEWVKGIKGIVDDPEKRKIIWSDGKDQFVVFKRKGSKPRSTISPEKLLSQGVPAQVIRQATTVGQAGKPGISVRKMMGPHDEPDED